MKKTYIQPATLLVKVALQQMVCTSPIPTDGTTDKEDDLLSRPDYGDNSSRRRSVWDDEDELLEEENF